MKVRRWVSQLGVMRMREEANEGEAMGQSARAEAKERTSEFYE
jgi:hypothetical protein